MLTKKTKYGLKALLVLAAEFEKNQPLLISKIAETERIPKKFLEIILLELKNNGILQSKMGKGGGYFLAKAPAKISMGDIIRVLDGPLSPLPCLSQTAYRKCDECLDESTCAIRLTMKDVRDETVRMLESQSLQDMLDKAHTTQRNISYSI